MTLCGKFRTTDSAGEIISKRFLWRRLLIWIGHQEWYVFAYLPNLVAVDRRCCAVEVDIVVLWSPYDGSLPVFYYVTYELSQICPAGHCFSPSKNKAHFLTTNNTISPPARQTCKKCLKIVKRNQLTAAKLPKSPRLIHPLNCASPCKQYWANRHRFSNWKEIQTHELYEIQQRALNRL